jgi:hypothetical protein
LAGLRGVAWMPRCRRAIVYRAGANLPLARRRRAIHPASSFKPRTISASTLAINALFAVVRPFAVVLFMVDPIRLKNNHYSGPSIRL